MGMVVDGLEGGPIGRLATDEPLRTTVVYLSLGMAIPDRLLDIGRVESALPEAALRVLGPGEAFDSHGQSLCGG